MIKQCDETFIFNRTKDSTWTEPLKKNINQFDVLRKELKPEKNGVNLEETQACRNKTFFWMLTLALN